jgi:hypothetical protein
LRFLGTTFEKDFDLISQELFPAAIEQLLPTNQLVEIDDFEEHDENVTYEEDGNEDKTVADAQTEADMSSIDAFVENLSQTFEPEIMSQTSVNPLGNFHKKSRNLAYAVTNDLYSFQ